MKTRRSRINENQKVTLSLGQLKRLVNEWYEPPTRNGLSDGAKKDADRQIKKVLREVEKASTIYNFRDIVNMLTMLVTSEQERKILEAGDKAEDKIANALQAYKNVLLSILKKQGYEVTESND